MLMLYIKLDNYSHTLNYTQLSVDTGMRIRIQYINYENFDLPIDIVKCSKGVKKRIVSFIDLKTQKKKKIIEKKI